MADRRRGGRGNARGRGRVLRDQGEVPRPGAGGAGRRGERQPQQQVPGGQPQPAVQQRPAPAGPPPQGVWAQRLQQQQQQAQQAGPAQGAVGGHPMPAPVGGPPVAAPVGGPPVAAPVGGPPMAAPQGPWRNQPPQAARGHPPQQQPAAQVAPPIAAGAGRAARRGTSRMAEEARAGDAARETSASGKKEEEGDRGRKDRPRFNPYEELPIRPSDPNIKKQGTSGLPVKLRANFFRMEVPQDLRLYQYHVDFVPYVDGTFMRKTFLLHHRDILGDVFIFDGTCLYLPHRLEDEEYVRHTLRLEDNAQIKITIKHACDLVGINPSVVQFLNIVWRDILRKMKLKQIKRNYFDVENKIEVKQHQLEVLSGFESSILRYENNVLLGIDVAHKMLRTTTVLDLMKEFCHGGEICTQEDKENILDNVVGQIVMTRYNNKTYTVHDIDFDKRVTDKFEKGRPPSLCTFIEYYQSQYQVRISNMNQPLLMTKSKKVENQYGSLEDKFINLVPELCVLTGLTEKHRSDFKVKKDLSVHTKVDPTGRVRKLEHFMGNVVKKDVVVAQLERWNFQFENRMVDITGRRLGSERLFMPGPRGRLDELEIRNGNWGVQGRSMILPVDMPYWVVVCPRRANAATKNMVDKLIAVGRPLGMNIGKPVMCCLDGDRYEDYKVELRKNVGPNAPTRMVFCVMPNNRKDRYDRLKCFLCLENPVASQMVLQKTLADCYSGRKDTASVATKIAIQMNCKLGGVIWTGEIPMKNSMIVGIDTYHDTHPDHRSAGGVVATVNSDYTRYKSTVLFQTKSVELHNHLHVALRDCLRAYTEANKGALPRNIILFRDGIGDGQLKLCLEHEVSQVKSVIEPLKIKLAFIVVKKRTNARFFLEGRGGGGRGGRGAGPGGDDTTYVNPEGGTVIDTVVTRPTWMDFYLIPQTVRVGSASPTHYNVLVNSTATLGQEHFQRLAYKLTHMYFNWQGTIRVPAPCMYAHKLAFLAGQSLHQNPNNALTNHLYYL